MKDSLVGVDVAAVVVYVIPIVTTIVVVVNFHRYGTFGTWDEGRSF